MTAKEIAEMLGISERRVVAIASENGIDPWIRIPRRYWNSDGIEAIIVALGRDPKQYVKGSE